MLGVVLPTLRRLQFHARLLDLLLDLGRTLQCSLFRLPDFVEIGEFALQLADVGFEIGEALLRGVVGLLLQHLALDLQLDQATLQAIELFRLGVDLHADARGGFVHQVDGLVRQLAIGDVAVGQRGGGDDGRIGDFHAVMHGVALLQATQDRDGVLDARLAHEHFLEAALQRGILLDVLAVFVERGGADAMQLAARQRGLEHIARVHRAIGLAGADHGVQFVDEQDDLAFVLGQIVEHGLQSLLELAAELGAGDQRAHVEREHAAIAQAFGHFALDDALRETFHNRGLADARLADQHGIVLGAPLQHLDRAADFLVAADHRIELAAFGARGQIDAVFLQRLALFLGVFALHFFAAAQLFDRRFKMRLRRAGGLQCSAQFALVFQRREHEQFAGDELIAALLRQLVGEIEQPRQLVADVHIAFLPADLGQPLEYFANALAQRRHIDLSLGQQRPGRAALLVEQRGHHVHRLEHVVIASDRQRLRIGERLLKTRGEFVHSHRSIPKKVWRTRRHCRMKCGQRGAIQADARMASWRASAKSK